MEAISAKLSMDPILRQSIGEEEIRRQDEVSTLMRLHSLGWSIHKISQALSMSRVTVRKVRAHTRAQMGSSLGRLKLTGLRERLTRNRRKNFQLCSEARFCTLSAGPDGCKIRIGSIYATTHFILHKGHRNLWIGAFPQPAGKKTAPCRDCL